MGFKLKKTVKFFKQYIILFNLGNIFIRISTRD